jgi:hypothetical protein
LPELKEVLVPVLNSSSSSEGASDSNLFYLIPLNCFLKTFLGEISPSFYDSPDIIGLSESSRFSMKAGAFIIEEFFFFEVVNSERSFSSSSMRF